ncbi:MAG TPA: hemolysin III family protein [Candidatus Margulisiibacteriota bacterium]|nr:hemolysin III family protein [Candidatus Margulisiibacteriota bacterium]
MHQTSERLTFGKMQNPVRGFLHGTAAVASVIGVVFLWGRCSGDLSRQLALSVFGLSLVGLYTGSSLYHSVPWQRVWKARMQRLDHSMIYILVAGTYTPLACIVFDGWLRWLALGAAWGIAVVGILQKIFLPKVADSFSIAMQTIQGWIALPLLLPLAQRLPYPALLLTALGGVLYTVGMVCLVTQRPRLWPRVFSHHEVFHVCVVAGSSAHYAVTFLYVARFGWM